MSAGVPIDHPYDLVGIGLVEPGPELLEDAECSLGVLAGLLVALAGEVNFGVVQQAEALQVHVAGLFGDLQTAAEVPVGVVAELPVGAHHTQVMVAEGAAALALTALDRPE